MKAENSNSRAQPIGDRADALRVTVLAKQPRLPQEHLGRLLALERIEPAEKIVLRPALHRRLFLRHLQKQVIAPREAQ